MQKYHPLPSRLHSLLAPPLPKDFLHALGDHEPELLQGDLNIEQIAALEPDVIVGLASGITEDQYVLLSQIAPTIAAEAEYNDYSTPWQVRAQTIGRVVGEADTANAMVGEIEALLAAIADGHPEWQSKTATVSFFHDGAPGTYRSVDIRPQLLRTLGFETPAVVDEAGMLMLFGSDFPPKICRR